ncbi:MAG: hypothetical protein II049_09510 [Clostridia bacterium]|nr:hypothetical protein [Clostridia bacterium]
MKHIYRFIGIVVVIIVLLGALLYFLNEKGILKGPISDWIENIRNDILSMFGHTKDMVNDMENTENPVTDSINIP